MVTYRECEKGFQTLLDEIVDLDSDTYRGIWFMRARMLRNMGCWEQCSNLMKLARAHDNGIPLNPIFKQFYRINRCSTINRSSSNVLSKEEKK